MSVLRAPEAMRARRAPFGVFAMFVWQLASGLIVATPIHAWARAAWGAHPDGDRVLWSPGARELLVWIGEEGPARAVALRSASSLVVLGTVLSLLPLGALLASLAFARREDDGRAIRTADALGLAMRSFVPLGSLFVLGAVLQLLLVLAFGLGGSALGHGLGSRVSDLGGITIRVLVTLLGVALALLVNAWLDVARAATVILVGGEGAEGGASEPPTTVRVLLRALRIALRVPRMDRHKAALAWASRGAAGVVLVLVAAKLTEALGVRAVVPLWILHQLVVLGRVTLRASWLARASALAARHLAPADSPAPAELAQARSDL